MRIHKVLSRGQGTDAQVLLVLVSTPQPIPPDQNVWVAIGRTAPDTILAADRSESIEPCRPLTAAELEALDLAWQPGLNPFDLDDHAAPRRHWLARFDFSDHPDVHRVWFRLAQSPSAALPGTLDVVTWRSRLVRKPDANGIARDYFEPQAGHAMSPVVFTDVVAQPLFELGVLFVHGIGNHAVRETLVRWTEPIVKIWRDRGFAIDKQACAAVPDEQRHRVTRWVRALQLRNRVPIDGIRQVADSFATSSNEARLMEALNPLVRPADAAPVTCCSATKTEETLFADSTPGQPSSTLLRVSTIDTNATLRESHVLFAEAYWTREAFPPTRSELFSWLTSTIPIAVWARMHRLIRIRPGEILAFAEDARNGFERSRVAVSLLIWLLQVAVLPAAYLVAALSGQIVLGVISLLGILPIPWLQRATRAVVMALMGTLGQSFALQTSSTRRSAIVSSVAKNLNWLSDKCHRVVVLSHSQGAEISRLAFLDSLRENVVAWLTAGSGIAPLSMLHPKSLSANPSRRVIIGSQFVLAAVAMIVAALAVDAIPGVHLGTRALLTQWIQRLSWQQLLAADLALVTVVAFVSPSGPEVRPTMRAPLLGKWRDFYASDDPVPGGSFVKRFEAELRRLHLDVPSERRIFNTRFSLLDHTSYFHNIEEFVAPIALDLLHLLGAGGEDTREKSALARARHRRDLRTWWNMLVSVVALLAFAASVAWVSIGPAHRSQVWFDQARFAWTQGPPVDFWHRIGSWWNSGLVGRVITDVRLSFVVLLALAAWWCWSAMRSYASVSTLINDLARASRSAEPSIRLRID